MGTSPTKNKEKPTKVVEILRDGLTGDGQVYLKGEFEDNPGPHLSKCADKGKLARWVSATVAKESTPPAGEGTETGAPAGEGAGDDPNQE